MFYDELNNMQDILGDIGSFEALNVNIALINIYANL